jgi:serine protease
VTYAVNRKAEILNCSWGGGFATQVLRDAITYALSEGVIVMMSAGNSSLDLDKSKEFPKMIPGLTLVASSDEKRAKSNSSNFGRFSVDWAVPGDRMLSTTKDGRYGEMSGTSMANALSSGITALALSAGDPLPANVLKRFCTTALRQGWESRVECGLLDPLAYFGFSNLNLRSEEK